MPLFRGVAARYSCRIVLAGGQMISIRSFIFAMAILAMTGVNAFADKRVALVIGNSSYLKVAKLSNPANDAAAVTAMFKSVGFDAVDTKLDLTVGELRRT
jgi:hypothetical protein